MNLVFSGPSQQWHQCVGGSIYLLTHRPQVPRQTPAFSLVHHYRVGLLLSLFMRVCVCVCVCVCVRVCVFGRCIYAHTHTHSHTRTHAAPISPRGTAAVFVMLPCDLNRRDGEK